ncbi:hypothetical protein O8C80_10685 [Aliarcobacter butzleri]|uniref:hypothetical protein n=1 Tax=Aliarcobacter butzleri TaxID=28197 RepID=UPI00263E947E|nr:hypothetical protein [Aliarcobacter butzleri]MDN5043792.1 hypothetical protein [Aliarcobacter butzleri]
MESKKVVSSIAILLISAQAYALGDIKKMSKSSHEYQLKMEKSEIFEIKNSNCSNIIMLPMCN